MAHGLFVLLAIVACSGVESANVDFAATLHAGLKDSALTIPSFAGLVQQHLGQSSSSSSSAKSSWRAQAQTFLGLLQSMGGQVPADKADQTRHYVDEIIKLLSTSSDDIFADAKTTKETTQKTLNKEFQDLQTTETATDKAFSDTKKADEDLAKCYKHLREIEANHSVHCGEKDLPPACVKKNNTKMHTFDVASKETWLCNFAAGSDPTKCTADDSPLKTDLVSHREAMRLAYQSWKLENKTCNDVLAAEKLLCENTNNTFVDKQVKCNEMFIDATDHLCHFRSKIDTWTKNLETLTETQTTAKTLLPPKKKEYTDLNLIICMMKTFRDRQVMTFTESDYSTCEAQAGDLAWVGEIDTLETETTTLVTKSTYSKGDCLEFSFAGGLAEKYMDHEGSGKPVKFFTEPEVVFSFTADGEGCTHSGEATMVCKSGFRVLGH